MSIGARRAVLWAGLTLLLATGLVYAFWPRPVPVDLGTAVTGPLEVTVSDEGETRVKDVYAVSTPSPGRLLRIEQEVGDEVTAGETVLATIRPADPTLLDLRAQREAEAAVKAAEAALSLATAELERARAELRFAEADLERARRLAERGNISQRTLDSERLDVKTGKAALASARANLQVKRFDLETARAHLISPTTADTDQTGTCCVEVRAPTSGQVLKILRESETVVAAGDALVGIGNPRDLEIVADLLSVDAVKVDAGAEVRIEQWGGAPLAGRVRRIEPTGFTKVSALGIEEQRVNVVIDIAAAPEAWRRLGHGYRVEVRIVVWQADDVVTVPLSSLFRTGNAWAVFVAADGRAALRQVEIGHMNSLDAEVLQGLKTGEHVVLHPSDRIADGTRIVDRKL